MTTTEDKLRTTMKCQLYRVTTFFLTDSRDDEERQLTEAEAIAVEATPILVILDKEAK